MLPQAFKPSGQVTCRRLLGAGAAGSLARQVVVDAGDLWQAGFEDQPELVVGFLDPSLRGRP